MKFLIRALDGLLRRAQGIDEFCDDGECLFRIRVRRLQRTACVAGRPLVRGTRIVELHFWNEHFPPIPAAGPHFGWGARGVRMLIRSLEQLAGHLRSRAELADIEGVMGSATFFSDAEAARRRRLLSRLGFDAEPLLQGCLGRYGELFENLHAWLLMWTFNREGVRGRRLKDLKRFTLYMPKEDLVQRYGRKGAPAARPPESEARRASR